MQKVLASIQSMYPGTFALVMATGIVSTGCKRLGFDNLGYCLFALNHGFFAIVLVLGCCRLALFPRDLVKDLTDHWRGAGFFTFPAAASVFGVQHIVFGSPTWVPSALWILAFASWIAINTVFFCAMIVGENQVDIHYAINGAWLTSVVAVQGLSVLLVGLIGKGVIDFHLGYVSALAFAGAGALLYFMLIASIFYRLVVHPIRAPDLSAPYWVNMGAALITSLAFSQAALNSSIEFRPALEVVAIAFWGFGTWWIPLLVGLGYWRHVRKRFPLNYNPRYWSLVFPLGMYVVSTHSLSQALPSSLFESIARVAIFVALSAWALVLVGLVRSGIQWFRSTQTSQV